MKWQVEFDRMLDEMPDQLSQRMSYQCLERMAQKNQENQPEYVSDRMSNRHQIKCDEMTEIWKIDCQTKCRSHVRKNNCQIRMPNKMTDNMIYKYICIYTYIHIHTPN